MKDKKKLLYERALITCVLMLFVCIILKLFGTTLFNLDTNIHLLNQLDKIIMDSMVLSFLYSFILLFINGYLICLIVTKVVNIKRYILPLTMICVTSIMYKTYVSVDNISFIIDTIGLLLVSIYVTNDLKIYKEYILVFILNLMYQLICIFIRDVTYQIAFRGLIIGVILNLDYYIMLIITYLYLKKGDTTICLMFHHFGSSLAKRLWKKHSQNSNQCSRKGEQDG